MYGAKITISTAMRARDVSRAPEPEPDDLSPDAIRAATRPAAGQGQAGRAARDLSGPRLTDQDLTSPDLPGADLTSPEAAGAGERAHARPPAGGKAGTAPDAAGGTAADSRAAGRSHRSRHRSRPRRPG